MTFFLSRWWARYKVIHAKCGVCLHARWLHDSNGCLQARSTDGFTFYCSDRNPKCTGFVESVPNVTRRARLRAAKARRANALHLLGDATSESQRTLAYDELTCTDLLIKQIKQEPSRVPR